MRRTAQLALGCLCALAACSKPAPQRAPRVPVVVAAARRTAVPDVISANGVVEPMQTVAVESQVEGVLTDVTFSEGQDVRAGQVLFQIDPRPYVAALQQARGQLARDQAMAANAQRDAARYAALVQQDYVTRSQADQAQATAASTAATVEADRAAVARAQIDVTNCTIRAPIWGRTGSLLIRRGNLVKANSAPPLVVINQIEPILVRFSLPQGQLPDVQRHFGKGDPLVVRATPSEGNGAMQDGTLSFVDNAVDSATGTVLLKARFANTAGALWPGQFVTVALQLDVNPNALTVPGAAVMTGQQGSYVFLVDNTGHARQHAVQVARTVDTLAVIASGLAAGDRVVVDGQSRLTPNAQVVVRSGNAPAARASGGVATATTPNANATVNAMANTPQGPGTAGMGGTAGAAPGTGTGQGTATGQGAAAGTTTPSGGSPGGHTP
jgi:multidrug efflux system membrane fusion protein